MKAVTSQSHHSHGTVAAQSQHSGGTVTAQSRHSRSTATAIVQLAEPRTFRVVAHHTHNTNTTTNTHHHHHHHHQHNNNNNNNNTNNNRTLRCLLSSVPVTLVPIARSVGAAGGDGGDGGDGAAVFISGGAQSGSRARVSWNGDSISSSSSPQAADAAAGL